MLTKLIGYEMRAFGRIMLPLYAATVGMSLLIGLGIRFLPEEAYSNFFGGIVIMIFITLIIATMVMTGVLCVQRFYQNLLGNEGYLMFSLPVGTHQLILSKVLASLIWTLLGGVAAVCTVLAMGLGAASLKDIAEALRQIHLYIDWSSLWKGLGSFSVWCLIGVLGFAAGLMQVYAAIAIGHQWTAHRILGSVLAYFGIDILKSTLAGILGNIGVYTGFWGFVMSQMENETFPTLQMQAVAAVGAVFYILVFSLVTWYFLDRRLNLE